MKALDTLLAGLLTGLLTPALAFMLFFKIRDPQLSLADVISRQVESGVISYYVSLCAIANLLAFFLFLRLNAEKAARGVLGATIIYAFIILFIKLR